MKVSVGDDSSDGAQVARKAAGAGVSRAEVVLIVSSLYRIGDKKPSIQ